MEKQTKRLLLILFFSCLVGIFFFYTARNILNLGKIPSIIALNVGIILGVGACALVYKISKK